MKLALVLIATISFLPAAYGVQLQTGNDFLRMATGTDSEKIFVYGYLNGINQSEDFAKILDLVSKGALKNFRFFCTPPTADAGQTMDVVVKWLREHPEGRDGLGYQLTRQALIAAWPCNK